ncbi:MAG TPA: hypothetical protein VFI76_02780 [Terrimicrobiaceae bacterium]|nr:hypothetical protein [Terrimicrobiaceae bacterium]
MLDESGVIGDGILSGISGPVALVGIAEKGFTTIEVSIEASPTTNTMVRTTTAPTIFHSETKDNVWLKCSTNPWPCGVI